MKKEEKKTLFLPTELYRKIEEKVKATGFDSVDEYVIFVLNEVLKEDEASGNKDDEEVKKRLRALGYLA